MRKITRLGFSIFMAMFLLWAGMTVLTVRSIAAPNVAPAACVPGPHNGHITADEEWCLADSPHQINGNVTVDPGVTLTIEPGVLVQAPSWPYYAIYVRGQLDAPGTATQPITFTSATPNDMYNWYGIIVEGGGANLQYTTVEYACNYIDHVESNVRVTGGGNLVLNHSTIQHCRYGGGGGQRNLWIDNSTAVINDSTLAHSTEYPIYITGADSVVTMTNNIIANNLYNRILLGENAMMGHDTTLTRQAADEGYQLDGNLTVPPTYTLTIEPGVLIQAPSWPHYGIYVQGQLDSLGTATEPITFTNLDPGYGHNWHGIAVEGGSANLRYTTVEYACRTMLSNVRVADGGSLVLDHSAIQHCGPGGGAGQRNLWIDNSTAIVSDSTFVHSAEYPIYITGADSVVTMTNNIIANNLYNRILLGENAMMGHDTTLVRQAVGEGYQLDGNLTVPPTYTLTIEPGVRITVKNWPPNIALNVEGRLEAVGTSTQPITITDIDNYHYWNGVVVNGGDAVLAYTTVENALGSYNSVYVHNGGSLTMTHSTMQGCNSLTVDSGATNISDSMFVSNYQYAINIVGGTNSHVTVSNSVLQNNVRGIYLSGGTQLSGSNNVFLNNDNLGIYVEPSASAALWHTTFSGGATVGRNPPPAGVSVRNGGTAVLTNTIFSHLGTAVRVDGGGVVTLTNTLWDANNTDVVGSITETEHIEGKALFEDDGYHLTRYSAAVGRGVNTGISSDIDGDARPIPAGTAPDLGADEIAESLNEIVTEKIAFQPQWIPDTDPSTGLPTTYLRQQYLLGVYYGTDTPNSPDLSLRITDTLPSNLVFEAEEHAPPMSFSAQGQRLVWQTEQPLAVAETAQIMLLATDDTPTVGQVMTNIATVNIGGTHFNLQDSTTVPLFSPLITKPGNGEICTSAELGGTQVIGAAMGNAIVHLYENGTEVLTTTVDAGGVFSVTYNSAHIGIDTQTTLTAKICNPANPTACSDFGNTVTLRPIQSFWCPQASSWTVPPDGDNPYAGTYEFKNPDTGEFVSDGWAIVGPHHFPPSSISLRLPDRGAQPPTPYITVDGNRIDPPQPPPILPPWIYNFPVPMRPYDIIFWNNLDPLDPSYGGRLIDPDGYIFDVTQGFDPISPTLHAVQGVTVTCMVSMTEWGGWVPWPAHLYNNQQNPQVTDASGYFAFFTPPGDYYLQVDGINGYQSWRSPVITVISDIVHVNVPYTPLSADTSAEVQLTPDGPQPAVITVPIWSTVEWIAMADGTQPPSVRMAQFENPSLRPLSDIDPIDSTRGFDGGTMIPGQAYRRRFDVPGTYTYTDGTGHTGKVVVTGSMVYLPLVMR